MDAERWQRLESLFLAAIDLPDAQRAAFVTRETTGDAELQAALAGMLRHEADGGPIIARTIESAAVAAEPSPLWPGRHCGAYRLVREIGRGGMGVVFEAVRDDDQYRKRVALKLAPIWLGSAPIAERFRLERQILAELEHPNIARFLDGGTEQGVPYFVMEYVAGERITDYCRTQRLDLPARLALFRQVCAAVHFAHQRLIVHRDLKPANIFVDAEGTPKLLDFGIAKLLDPTAADSATLTVERAWTPDYASPEQMAGGTITTRTDVYALGLILYELITGERAHDANLERLPREWRGDLETIVATATRKEPERRYDTAAALSADLGNFLDGRPIAARPATAGYRTRKFVRRHRAGVAVTTVLAATVVAGVGATAYEARRANRRFQQVRSLANAFVFDVHDQIENIPGSTQARKTLVQTALTYLESLRPEAKGDAALSRELAAAYERIGNAQGNPLKTNLGDGAGALASYTHAIELLTPLTASGDRVARKQLVNVLLWRGTTLYAKGDLKPALAEFARAAATGEALLRDTPSDWEVPNRLCDVYSADARAAVGADDLPRAEASSRRAIEVARLALALNPAAAVSRDGLATAYNALGQTLDRENRIEESIVNFRSSTEIRESLVKASPNDTELRRNLMISYGNLGDMLGYMPGANLGDTAGALAAFAKARDLAEWAHQHDPADRRAVSDLVNVHERIGPVLTEDPKRLDEALQQFVDAEPLIRQLRAAEPTRYSYAFLDAYNQRRMGIVLVKLHRNAEATRRFESARAIALALFAESPSAPSVRTQVVLSTIRLALMRAAEGDPRAVALADEASVQFAQGRLGAPFDVADAYSDLGRVYLESARHVSGDPRPLLTRALTNLEQSLATWRSMHVIAPMEPQRRDRQAAVQALLDDCRARLR